MPASTSRTRAPSPRTPGAWPRRRPSSTPRMHAGRNWTA